MADRAPVWVDVDDSAGAAFALLLAGHAASLRLLGVSTTYTQSSPGLVRPAAAATAVALTLLHSSGLSHVPVVEGCARPLVRAVAIADEEPASTAATLFPDARAVDAKAVNYLAAVLSGAHARLGRAVTLVALGALTNIALLLRVHPEAARDIERVVVIGGPLLPALGGLGGSGAASPVQADAEAAAVVFESGVPVVLLPRDAAAQRVPEDVADALDSGAGVGDEAGADSEDGAGPGSSSTFRAMLSSLLTSLATPAPNARARAGAAAHHDDGAGEDTSADNSSIENGDDSRRDGSEGPGGAAARGHREQQRPMSQPRILELSAVYLLLAPEAFESRLLHVEIERTPGSVAYGQVIADWGGVRPHTSATPRNCTLCSRLWDAAPMWRALLQAVAAADAGSVLNTAGEQKRARARLAAHGASIAISAAASSGPRSPAAVAAERALAAVSPLRSPANAFWTPAR